MTRPARTKKEQIAILASRGNTEREIATLTNTPKTTVHRTLQALQSDPVYAEFVKNKDKSFEALQYELIKYLDHEKLKEMSGLQLITGTAILQDKVQTIRGQATEIIDHRHLHLDLDAAVAALRDAQQQDEDVLDVEIEQPPSLLPSIDDARQAQKDSK